MGLLDQGGAAGHQRGGHRGAGHRGVGVDAASAGGGALDVDAGRGDLGLEGVAAGDGAVRGEVRGVVLAVDGADGEHGGSAAGRADGLVAAEVAGGDHEQRLGVLGDALGGDGHRVGAVGGFGAAEGHRHHVGAGVGGPLHAGDDLRVGAGAAVVEDLADQQPGLFGDAALGAAGGLAGAGDLGGDEGAVADGVVDVLVGGAGVGAGEVAAGVDLSGQVGVLVVDAGVEDGDLDALSAEAGGPGGRSADLLVLRVVGGADLAVQPELGQPVAALAVGADELVPGAGRVVLRGGERDAVDGLELLGAGGPGAGLRAGLGGPRVAVGGDEGKRFHALVVVALAQQRTDVEQAAVDGSGGERGGGVLRDDVLVAVLLLGEGQRDVAVLVGQHGDGGAAVAAGADLHPVAGDQGDGARGRALTSRQRGPGGAGLGRDCLSGRGEHAGGEDARRHQCHRAAYARRPCHERLQGSGYGR